MWNSGRGEVVGHGALSDAFLQIMELFQHVLQLTHNGEVNVDGDAAHGCWYITEYGLTAKQRRTFYIAHYDDDYRRTADGWKFQRRTVTWHYHYRPTSVSGTARDTNHSPHNKALQPTANPLRGLSAAELGRYVASNFLGEP
jgi:hypothetical protein